MSEVNTEDVNISNVFDGDRLLSEKPIKILLEDFLPTTNELANFAILLRNRGDLIDESSLNEGNEEELAEWELACNEYGIDPVSTFNALLIARLFYLAQTEIEVVEDEH